MPSFFAPRALLPQGWARNVRIAVSAEGVITGVEQNATPEETQSLPGIQLLSGIVLPAMANLHSHAFQRAMAGLAEVAGDLQDSFWIWRDLMYRLVGHLTPEQVGAIASRLYIEMLKGGYTQVAEFHYLHHDPAGQPYAQDDMLLQLMTAAARAGIGQTLLPVLYSYAGFGAQPALPGQRRFIQDTEHYLAQQQRLATLLRDKPLHTAEICFHSLRAVSESQINEVLAAMPATLPVHIHIAEQVKEVEDCVAWSGERPVNWLYDRFAVDERWTLIHATHLDERELQRVAASGAIAGLCPTTEANLGDGIFALDQYVALGGRWGIGSDSHVSLNLLEELRWLEYTQRLRDRRRNRVVTPEQPAVGDVLYRQALAPGYRADWLVLEDNAWLHGLPDRALLNRWLFAGERQQIHDVWVAGKQVIHQGRHALDDESDRQFVMVMDALGSL